MRRHFWYLIWIAHIHGLAWNNKRIKTAPAWTSPFLQNIFSFDFRYGQTNVLISMLTLNFIQLDDTSSPRSLLTSHTNTELYSRIDKFHLWAAAHSLARIKMQSFVATRIVVAVECGWIACQPICETVKCMPEKWPISLHANHIAVAAAIKFIITTIRSIFQWIFSQFFFSRLNNIYDTF